MPTTIKVRQNGSLLVEEPVDHHPLVADHHLSFYRNLRYMGDQSKRHPGSEVGERRGGRAFAARNVVTFIADKGEHPAGFRL